MHRFTQWPWVNGRKLEEQLPAAFQLSSALRSQFAMLSKCLIAPLVIHRSSCLAGREVGIVGLVVQGGAQQNLIRPGLELIPPLGPVLAAAPVCAGSVQQWVIALRHDVPQLHQNTQVAVSKLQ